MNIEEIKALIDNTAEMELDLEKESRRIPKMHAKAINIRAGEIALLRALEIEMDSRKRERWIFYSGKAEPHVYKDDPFNIKLLKNEVDDFVLTDKKIVEIRSKIEMQKIKISALDEYIKSINNRNFLIRSAIDYQRLMAGLS